MAVDEHPKCPVCAGVSERGETLSECWIIRKPKQYTTLTAIEYCIPIPLIQNRTLKVQDLCKEEKKKSGLLSWETWKGLPSQLPAKLQQIFFIPSLNLINGSPFMCRTAIIYQEIFHIHQVAKWVSTHLGFFFFSLSLQQNDLNSGLRSKNPVKSTEFEAHVNKLRINYQSWNPIQIIFLDL